MPIPVQRRTVAFEINLVAYKAVLVQPVLHRGVGLIKRIHMFEYRLRINHVDLLLLHGFNR